MLTVEMREPRRVPSGGEATNDAPSGLRGLADVEKAAAVALGLERLTARAFAVEIESVNYGAWDRLREFAKPAELRTWVSSRDGDGCACLQVFADQEIEAALAAALGEAAGEGYRVRITDKRYAAPGVAREMRLTVLVGRV
jgi:hypothetical protein